MLSQALENRFQQWLNRRHSIRNNRITLHRRRIYILPSRLGYAFCIIWLVMLLWAINYTNSLAFMLTFLLAAVSLNAMWRTHNNLLGVTIRPGPVEPVFAGQPAQFGYFLNHAEYTDHYGLGLQWRKTAAVFTDITAGQTAQLAITVPTTQRGRLQPGAVRVITYFPLGLFRAWSWLLFDQYCLVYPAPAGQLALPTASPDSHPAQSRRPHQQGNDDYSSLRNYVSGDSPRHIAWRASARSHSLFTKQFVGHSRDELWLDWQQLSSTSLDTEAKLSQLCQWILSADSLYCNYGLRLPGVELTPNHGSEHKRCCLQALALFEN